MMANAPAIFRQVVKTMGAGPEDFDYCPDSGCPPGVGDLTLWAAKAGFLASTGYAAGELGIPSGGAPTVPSQPPTAEGPTYGGAPTYPVPQPNPVVYPDPAPPVAAASFGQLNVPTVLVSLGVGAIVLTLLRK